MPFFFVFFFVNESSTITGIIMTYLDEAASHYLQLEWVAFRHRFDAWFLRQID